MTDCKDRKVVYRMKPVFEIDAQIRSSSSMYKLKNLQTSPVASITSANNTQTNLNTVKIEDQEKTVARQEKLLSNLDQLQKEVSALQIKLKELKSSHSVQNTNCSNIFNKEEIHDFVINADPNYPPYALLWLPKLWNLSMKITIHLHSSVQSLPKNLSVFDSLKNDEVDVNCTSMVFVWKKVGVDTQLIVSPMKYKIILGEVNILRFFDYILHSQGNMLEQIYANEILDLAHRLNYVSNRGQQSIIAQIQKHLGNKKWFISKPSISDAAIWSALLRLKRNTVPASLNTYLLSCTVFSEMDISSRMLKELVCRYSSIHE